jgi:multisubunit Na+/H+ antiporter MnhF subunit
MRTEFLIAAVALLIGLVPLAVVTLRERPVDGLVALGLGSTVTTLALVCFAVGTQSSADTGVALITAVLGWAGGLLCARFLDRVP